MRACIYQETFVALMGNIDEFLIAAFLALASHGFTHHSATMGRNEARIAAAQALRGLARVRNLCYSPAGKRVAARYAKGLRKVCEEVVRKRGAATRG